MSHALCEASKHNDGVGTLLISLGTRRNLELVISTSVLLQGRVWKLKGKVADEWVFGRRDFSAGYQNVIIYMVIKKIWMETLVQKVAVEPIK